MANHNMAPILGQSIRQCANKGHLGCAEAIVVNQNAKGMAQMGEGVENECQGKSQISPHFHWEFSRREIVNKLELANTILFSPLEKGFSLIAICGPSKSSSSEKGWCQLSWCQ